MKNLKIFTFGILVVGMHLTSCKKDVDQQLQQSTPAENKENVFEKSVTVYNADKTNNTTLRFRAVSKEQLDKMSNVEFTLIKNPEVDPKAIELIAPTIAGDEGFSGYLDKGASLLPQGMNKALPKDAIQIELPNLPSVGSSALEMTSKDESVTAASTTFYFVSGYHRIQVTNRHTRPIIVDFYSFAGGLWRYSGFSYKLFQNTFAWYQHCTRTVGADVTYPTQFRFKVTYTPFCQ
jgi:hypothetical protein